MMKYRDTEHARVEQKEIWESYHKDYSKRLILQRGS